MNQRRNRADVCERILEIATSELTDVVLYDGRTETFDCGYSWDTAPSDPAKAYLRLGVQEGESAPASVGSAGRTDDEWALQGQIVVPACPTPILAMKAAEAGLNALDGYLRDNQRLAGSVASENDPAPGETAIWAVRSAVITTVTGPYHAPTSIPTSQPGVVDFTVTITTEIK